MSTGQAVMRRLLPQRLCLIPHLLLQCCYTCIRRRADKKEGKADETSEEAAYTDEQWMEWEKAEAEQKAKAVKYGEWMEWEKAKAEKKGSSSAASTY